jgi:cell division protein ZapE
VSSVLEFYQMRVDAGELECDAAQRDVAARLDRLAAELEAPRAPAFASPLDRLFGMRKPAPAPLGLYIHGAVGRGKTMLMDLFFQAVGLERKRRVHFHGFMADAHARIYDWRQKRKFGVVRGEDPIAPVAEQIASEARLLCFDEFAVTDIADAMVLGRLFTRLFELGVVVVATSNVAPDRLYEGGLNRALFLPFIRLLTERLEVVELRARADFRLEKLAGVPVWLTPVDAAAKAALDRAFLSLAGGACGAPFRLSVFGRDLVAPEAAGTVARFSFHDLCENPLGPSDYLAIARQFHTILVDGVPVMGPEKRNEARRFVWLVDALYDMRVKLLASAEAQPDALYQGQEGNEAFEFARAASRLIEMRSQDYLALPHGRPASEASGDVSGLAET